MIKKPRKVIILGSSALRIGQAGEFDYSGVIIQSPLSTNEVKGEKLKVKSKNPYTFNL